MSVTIERETPVESEEMHVGMAIISDAPESLIAGLGNASFLHETVLGMVWRKWESLDALSPPKSSIGDEFATQEGGKKPFTVYDVAVTGRGVHDTCKEDMDLDFDPQASIAIEVRLDRDVPDHEIEDLFNYLNEKITAGVEETIRELQQVKLENPGEYHFEPTPVFVNDVNAAREEFIYRDEWKEIASEFDHNVADVVEGMFDREE